MIGLSLVFILMYINNINEGNYKIKANLAQIKEIIKVKKHLINQTFERANRKLEMENPLTGHPRGYIITQTIYKNTPHCQQRIRDKSIRNYLEPREESKQRS